MRIRAQQSSYSHLSRLPQFEGLELLRASYATHVFPRHWNETFIIQLVDQGVNEFYCDGKTHRAAAGSLVLINAYEVHTGCSAGTVPLVYRSLYLTPELFNRMAALVNEGREDSVMLASPVVLDARLARMIAQVHHLAATAAEDLELQSALLQTLSHVLRHHSNLPPSLSKARSENAALQRAREYLHAHYAENVSLAELAQHAYLSPFHLLRTFRNALGMPPHEYLTNLRIERAKHLLAAGHPISQVAFQTGFIDQSHFHRRFKHLVGVTPGQFLKMSNFVQDYKSAVH